MHVLRSKFVCLCGSLNDVVVPLKILIETVNLCFCVTITIKSPFVNIPEKFKFSPYIFVGMERLMTEGGYIHLTIYFILMELLDP